LDFFETFFGRDAFQFFPAVRDIDAVDTVAPGVVRHVRGQMRVGIFGIFRDLAEDAVALQRFFNEAKASGRVRSTSIVQIFDLGQAEDGSPFLVFELLEGEGLDARLAREGMLDCELGADLFVGAARALHLAHQQGIIHRDLKPANIILDREADGKLVAKRLDFGSSKVFE